MEIWQAAVLGLVQGLTEFLPVSSSGHLMILQRLFGLDGGLFIPIVLHLGTLVSVCIAFRGEIAALFKKPFKTLVWLVLATVPAGIVGVFAGGVIEEQIGSGQYAGILLAALFTVTAAVLFITETVLKRREKARASGDAAAEKALCGRTVLSMALAQAAAVFPGISRSGATVCAGSLAGGERGETARFSFLMSVPVILGSFVIDVAKGLSDGGIQSAFASGGWRFGVAVGVGFFISAAVGLLAIRLMMKAVRNADYKWFSLYLVCLAAVCAVLNFTGRLGSL